MCVPPPMRPKFPFVLDMEPYTAEGMARQDEIEENEAQVVPDLTSSESDTPTIGDLAPTPKSSDSDFEISGCGSGEVRGDLTTAGGVYVGPATSKQINYELVGVVVHSGQANAGHYYSYIKDRR